VKLQDINVSGVRGRGDGRRKISQTAILAVISNYPRPDDEYSHVPKKYYNGTFGLKSGGTRQLRGNRWTKNLPTDAHHQSGRLKNCDLVIETIGGGPSGQVETRTLN